MIKNYINKNLKIQAVQLTTKNLFEITDFLGIHGMTFRLNATKNSIVIAGDGEDMAANLGDYIVKGITGNFCVYPAGRFKETYVEFNK